MYMYVSPCLCVGTTMEIRTALRFCSTSISPLTHTMCESQGSNAGLSFVPCRKIKDVIWMFSLYTRYMCLRAFFICVCLYIVTQLVEDIFLYSIILKFKVPEMTYYTCSRMVLDSFLFNLVMHSALCCVSCSFVNSLWHAARSLTLTTEVLQ